MYGEGAFTLLALSLLLTTGSASQSQTDLIRPRPPVITRDATLHSGLLHSPITEPVSPPHNPGPPGGLSHMVRAAGMIFSGTVTRIERRPAVNGQPLQTITITFHVENALRGATAGHDIRISQWIGLWYAGQRYRLGERVFLFLYPTSRLGLTSLVAGPAGRFDVDPWGYVRLSLRHLSAFRVEPVLGGKSRVPLRDFALAVRRAYEEE